MTLRNSWRRIERDSVYRQYLNYGQKQINDEVDEWSSMDEPCQATQEFLSVSIDII
jgi:hypothetical protein